MNRQNFSPNPYCQGAPFDSGFGSPSHRGSGFRPPRPPAPRFHQQFVPHHSMSPPHFNNPRSGPSPQGPRWRNHSSSGHSPRGDSMYSTPSPNRNGRYHRNSGDNSFKNNTPYKNRHNSQNNDDINLYYNKSMIEDPWRDCVPIPAQVPANITT